MMSWVMAFVVSFLGIIGALALTMLVVLLWPSKPISEAEWKELEKEHEKRRQDNA